MTTSGDAAGLKVIIFSRGRSGSNALFRAFSCHFDIRGISEPFNSVRYEGRYKADTPEEVLARLRELGEEFNLLKHVWSEAGWPFKSADCTQQLLRQPGPVFVLLHRRNVLERYISAHIAAATAMWDADPGQNKAAAAGSAIPPLNRRELRTVLAAELGLIAEYTAVLQARGAKFTELWYEDLFAESRPLSERLALLESTFSFAGLDPGRYDRKRASEVLDPAAKMNDLTSYRQVPDIEEIAETYGCDSTGRIDLDALRRCEPA